MAVFYRGAGLGTHWWATDARQSGFAARAPRNQPSIDRLMQHIGGSNQTAPFVSLTRSYAVAWDYAVKAGRAFPAENEPAFVYEIEIGDEVSCRLIDPIKEIAASLPEPLMLPAFQHDGGQDALIGIVDKDQVDLLTQPVRYPPPQPAKPNVNVGAELRALVRALRDAEVVAVDHVPARCVVERHEVW